MQNMKSYFSSWKTFWKSSTSNAHAQTLTLAPSSIHFTDSSLGDLKYSIVDEHLMNDISRKLIDSDCPPKLQICAQQNQWFALNNSHLLVYRQLERIGLCDAVVCDIIRNEDIPIGIRQTLIPIGLAQSEANPCSSPIGHDKSPSHDEVMYCADIQADSCAYFDDEEACDGSIITNGGSESEDERSEWSTNHCVVHTPINSLGHYRFDNIDLQGEDDEEEDKCLAVGQKERQSLLPF